MRAAETWQLVRKNPTVLMKADQISGVWRNKEDAAEGGRGPWHKQARTVIPQMYQQISIRDLRLVVGHGAAAWSFE